MWPAVNYEQWRETCDTLHAHTQVLGKLAAKLAPAEPQLQHAALRLTARGWETLPLPAPDRSVPWQVALDADEEHAHYDPGQVSDYFAAATRVAQVLAAYRAPYRGRSTPVNAWWGSFDLSVSLFSGMPAEPPSADFIMRNAMDAQEVAVGWWPGDGRYGRAAFYAYAHPAPAGFDRANLPGARWDGTLGEYVMDWDDVRTAEDPYATALEFARSAFRHACVVCGWDTALAASADGTPPPVS